jgi:branched-chain amino acid aminotransferase
VGKENKREVFLNGRFLREDAAVISIFDRGLLYGDGLFETLRTYSGRPFRLEAHLERLASSAAFLKISVPLKKEEIKAALLELLRRNRLADAYVRITLTRGPYRPPARGAKSASGLGLETEEPTLFIVTREFKPYPARRYRFGAKAIIFQSRRSASSPVIQHKTLNYLANILARAEAQKKSADEAILLNTAGFLTEATVSNLFIAKKGEVFTPPVSAGLLPGITREVVLEICRASSIAAKEKNLRPRDLARADESFLTNSLMEIMPLCYLNGKPIGEGRVGDLTRRLRRLYKAVVKKELGL